MTNAVPENQFNKPSKVHHSQYLTSDNEPEDDSKTAEPPIPLELPADWLK